MPTPIDVIIPCFNAARFVAQTLDSVLAQTVPARIVAVDDGSTDDTLRILHGYADRIAIVRHPGGVNRGPAASRNLGFASSRSPFVAFLDADDIWKPEKLALEARVLSDRPDLAVVVSGCQAIDPLGRVLYDFDPWPVIEDADLASALLLDCFIQTPGQALFRRSVLEETGLFDSDLIAVEDHDFWIRLAERGRFAFLPDLTVQYRKHQSSLSSAGSKRMWQLGFNVVAKAERRCGYGTAARERRGVLHYRLAQCAWQERAYLTTMWHAFQAGAHAPHRAFQQIWKIGSGLGARA